MPSNLLIKNNSIVVLADFFLTHYHLKKNKSWKPQIMRVYNNVKFSRYSNR